MKRRQPAPLPPHEYTSEIEFLRQQITALTQRWRGVAPAPPSLAEAVEELAVTFEELHAVNEDLTQAQQAAVHNQQRYQELFEWAPEAYIVTDLHGVIQEANQAAADLLNIARHRLVGIPLAVFIAREERQPFRTQLAWLENGAEVREWKIRIQPRHKPAFPAVCRVAPARDVDGQLIGLRWLLRDITTWQQAQETLEQRIRERTAELAHANTALQAALDRAERLLQELHHRVKNNLQVVASLLDLQSEFLQDSHARAIFHECQERIRAMALVHELLYQVGDLEQIELAHYLRSLAAQLFQSYGVDPERIHLTMQADTVYLDGSAAIPCGLLAHEVLSNCLQHAFPAQQTGEVSITLQVGPPGQVTLTIRDTGVGLPEDLDVRRTASLGLQLVCALTEQLHGTIAFTRDTGTCVTLTFPSDQRYVAC
jgi:PAS domain S-box-containing protein